MPDQTRWQVLNVDLQNVPKLLFRYETSTSGYRIQLTDLSQIWEENLTRDDCIQRASDTNSSIDPGEDDEQINILLSKIRSALCNEPGTSLNLQPGGNDEKNLVVSLTAPLPKPLRPFRWSIQLQRLDNSQVERYLVSPLLARAHQLQSKIEQLVHELHDKDRVISKICDRLETSGNDLTTVFPGVSNVKTSRKKSQREQLAKHIKGLADFDEKAWSLRSDGLSGSAQLTDDDLNAVFQNVSTSTTAHTTHPKWWQSLAEPRPMGSLSPRSTQRSSKQQAASSRQETSIQDDDFQRQDTSPGLRSSSPIAETTEPHDAEANVQLPEADRSPPDEDDGGSTTDTDDVNLDAPSKGGPGQASQRMKTQLGKFGGRRQRKSSTPPKSPRKPPALPAKKLATIGGKAKTVTPVPARDSTTPEKNSSSPPKKRTIGLVGGKRKVESMPEPVAETEVADAVERAGENTLRDPARMATKEPSPAPRETSQERADKKRDQLRREMEKKAAAPPAKKKRKF